MLRRLLGRLLRAIAATIRRWADLVLAEPPAPATEIEVAPPALERPPQHWLERVRRDAPQLLAPATEEGAPPQVTASPPEPAKPRTGRVAPGVFAPRVPSEPASPRRAPEEPGLPSDRPSRGHTAARDGFPPPRPSSPDSPARVDVLPGPTRTRVSEAADLPAQGPRHRPAAAASHGELRSEHSGDERTTPPPARPAVVTMPPEHLDGVEVEGDDAHPGDVHAGGAPPRVPHAASVAVPRAETARSIDGELRPSRATPTPSRTGSPSRAQAVVVAVPEPTPPAHLPRAVSPNWPSHAQDRPAAPPPAENLESRWPELPPDAPSDPPAWTQVLSALRRARSLEREQRGED